jgi:hypothetical protein
MTEPGSASIYSEPLDYDFRDWVTTDPIGLEQAAAELGVPPPALRERIGGLPELAVLADPSATIPRSTLVEGSSRALCALGMRNRPVTCP